MQASLAPPDPLERLGSMAVRDFMQRYWQRRPLLIRRALPDALRTNRSTLAQLAARDDVESRLVTRFAGRWQLAHGPFTAAQLPSPRKSDWTLLVQGVNLHDRCAHALLQRFRFLPDARLDDVMISYATAGGGVGPHLDSYDVFLLQLHGRRRWRISRQGDRALVPGLPLKVLAHFRPSHEWVLEPGDMLYLPPNVAHEGTALDECITCSIGFRAPAWQELVEPWHAHLAEQTQIPGRYGDAGERATTTPARLPDALIQQTYAQLTRKAPTPADARRMLLATLSDPKPQVVFARPARLAPARFAALARSRGVALDPKTRLLYAGTEFGINGEWFTAAVGVRAELKSLADRRRLDGAQLRRPNAVLLELLHRWYVAGWLGLNPTNGR